MERQKKNSFFILEFYRYFMKIKAPTVFELGTCGHLSDTPLALKKNRQKILAM